MISNPLRSTSIKGYLSHVHLCGTQHSTVTLATVHCQTCYLVSSTLEYKVMPRSSWLTILFNLCLVASFHVHVYSSCSPVFWPFSYYDFIEKKFFFILWIKVFSNVVDTRRSIYNLTLLYIKRLFSMTRIINIWWYLRNHIV